LWCIILGKLTLILLTWRIGWAPNNARKWQMGFNSAFKALKSLLITVIDIENIYCQIMCCVSTCKLSSPTLRISNRKCL
jgi:hypothetical protein